MNSNEQILLSVVATSRNDNHGKNLLYRMQQFVDGFVEQCKRHDLRAELILVEWNPPENTLPLSEALVYPKDKGPCTIRIIRVPKEAHMQLDHSDKIPLYQMIGKNVGIRRAAGKFILATNIDVLFSDELISYLKTNLTSGCLYRVDRLDVPEKLPEGVAFENLLGFCRKNVLRINAKYGTILMEKQPKSLAINRMKNFTTKLISVILEANLVMFYKLSIAFSNKIKRVLRWSLCTFYPANPFISHTNACGDFTLLSSQDWSNIRGYPEWNTFSWHVDSVLIFQAKQHGIKEMDLPRKLPIYHIEHEAGSGFSPENAHLLFKRLDDKGIPYLSDKALKELLSQMKKSKEKVIYNDTDWGMAKLPLEEVIIS